MSMAQDANELLLFLETSSVCSGKGPTRGEIRSTLRLAHPALIRGEEVDSRREPGRAFIATRQTHPPSSDVQFGRLLMDFAAWAKAGRMHKGSTAPLHEADLVELLLCLIRLSRDWAPSGDDARVFRNITPSGDHVMVIARCDGKTGCYADHSKIRTAPEGDFLSELRKL